MVLEETIKPEKGPVSDVILIALVVVGTVLLRWLGGLLGAIHPSLDLAVQMILFVGLIYAIYVIAAKRLVSFRHTLSEKQLTVFRSYGQRERPMETVALKNILSICPYADVQGSIGRENRLCVGKKELAIAVRHRQGGEINCLLFSPGEEMLKELTARWKAAAQADCP